MTSSEFSFLVLGLLLGIVSGAALLEIVRARPPAPREVRVTVAHDAIPRRRSATLADHAFATAAPEPARGGPADRRAFDELMPPGSLERRTTVRFGALGAAASNGSVAGAIPVGPGSDGPQPGRIMEPVFPLVDAATARGSGPHAERIAIRVAAGHDPIMGELRETIRRAGVATAVAAGSGDEAAQDEADEARVPARAMTAVALLDPPSGSRAAPTPGATERCAEERLLATERCELATRSRAQADAAADALRVAQRAYDAHETASAAASARAHPRAVHAAKEAAQGGFRAAVAAATTPEALEGAARDWLTEINRINNEARESSATSVREHEAAVAIAMTLERLGLEADAARIGAATADAGCLAARVAVADCEERPDSVPPGFLIPPTPADTGWGRLEEDETLGIALEEGATPRIFRLLRGDRAAMASLVISLGGTSPDQRRHWQLLLTGLVEAIVADAIEASALVFPQDHEFWGPFTRAQSRDIAHALASLGFRFDGLGGWIDARYPTQRDMSLALGYVGLDPMRVRRWPTEQATMELYRDVTVAADEYLASVAGDLTLSEMVTMLGRRADGLAEVWNQWGRLRPLLLDET